MAPPPCYADLGKQARDIFSKSYHFSLIKLDCKTKTASGLEFNVSGTSDNESGRVTASLETKYKVPDYGMTLKEKWNTANVLATEVTVEDQLLKGLKLSFDSTFVPQTGKKAGLIKTEYKMDNVHVNCDVDLDPNGPIMHGSAVLGLQGWLAGAQASFDSSKNKLMKTNFALGYAIDDFVLHTNVNDGQDFGGAVYQRVNQNLETGVQLAWKASSNATQFGLGCVYSLDNNTSFRVKINNLSQLGFGMSHRLREGIQLTLSAMIDGKNFNQGGHKLGIGLDLQG